MQNIWQMEKKWNVEIVAPKPDFEISCEKEVIFFTEEKSINQVLLIKLAIFRNIVDEVFRKEIIKRQNLFDKIGEMFFPTMEELNPSQLNIITQFGVYFFRPKRNIGTAKMRFHTNYHKVLEVMFQYEYSNKNSELLCFYALNRFDANAVFFQMLREQVVKIEIEPVENDSFERLCFVLQNSDYFELSDKVKYFTRKLGFTIKGI